MRKNIEQVTRDFYSHVNYSVTKIRIYSLYSQGLFYSHVNYSVTKMGMESVYKLSVFYSHVNYSVTKIVLGC